MNAFNNSLTACAHKQYDVCAQMYVIVCILRNKIKEHGRMLNTHTNTNTIELFSLPSHINYFCFVPSPLKDKKDSRPRHFVSGFVVRHKTLYIFSLVFHLYFPVAIIFNIEQIQLITPAI